MRKSKRGIGKSRNSLRFSRTEKQNIVKYIGCGSIGILLILLSLMLMPTISGESYATDSTGYGEMRTNVNVAPVVSVAMQSKVDVDVTPKHNGSYAMATSKLTVATNSDNGYSVYIKSGNKTTNNLLSTDNTNDKYIAAMSGAKPLASMQSNTWGYALSAGEISETSVFSAVPMEAGSAIATTDKDSVNLGSGNTYNLAFGVNIDTSLPAGQYTGSVIISAVANPITVTSLYQLTYMQDMTTDICANTGTEVTKQLIDTRDGKSYWVAKLADGNCWMTQNLAFDLVEGATLTPNDTNVTSDWVVPTGTTFGSGNLNDYSDISGNDYAMFFEYLSWNFGEYVLSTPELAEPCIAPNATESQIKIKVSLLANQSLNQCQYMQDVKNYMPNFTAQVGTWRGEKTGRFGETDGIISADVESKTYDAHYTIGNYYMFNAATAGHGGRDVRNSTDNITDDASSFNNFYDNTNSSSICPKGWELPKGGKNTTTFQPVLRDKSFAKLLAAYNIPNAEHRYDVSNATHNPGSPIPITASGQALSRAPFYLVRTGTVGVSSRAVLELGMTGQLWTSTPANFANDGIATARAAYLLDYRENWFYPTSPWGRVTSAPIRCVAQ